MIFLLLFLFSLISLDIDIGNEKVDRVINKLNVGKINIYSPIPLVVIALVRNILITILNILVNRPPIRRIIVDLINLLFI